VTAVQGLQTIPHANIIIQQLMT